LAAEIAYSELGHGGEEPGEVVADPA
jgi:hypothetical protein